MVTNIQGYQKNGLPDKINLFLNGFKRMEPLNGRNVLFILEVKHPNKFVKDGSLLLIQIYKKENGHIKKIKYFMINILNMVKNG